MRTLFSTAAPAALLVSASAVADIYKWVDEKGVTNYSNASPAQTTVKAEVVVQDTVSSYPSDPAALRAMVQTARQAQIENLVRRVDQLERELAAQRQANQYGYATGAPAYNGYGGYGYGYGVPYVVAAPIVVGHRFIRRSVRFARFPVVSHIGAGNMVTFRSASLGMHRGLRSR